MVENDGGSPIYLYNKPPEDEVECMSVILTRLTSLCALNTVSSLKQAFFEGSLFVA